MSLFRRLSDPLKLGDRVEHSLGPTAASALRLSGQGPLGNAGDLKKLAGTPLGSIASGRALVQRGIKPLGSNARTMDIFGSPASAGTNQQTTARLAALLYGAWAGLGGLGGLGGSSVGGGPAGSSGGATSSGSGTALRYLNMGRRGLGMYNMLNSMGGGGEQPAGGQPMTRERSMPHGGGYGQPQQQRPPPGSGPFDWLRY